MHRLFAQAKCLCLVEGRSLFFFASSTLPQRNKWLLAQLAPRVFSFEARHGPLRVRCSPLLGVSTRLSENVVDTRIKVGRQTNYSSQERALDPESTTRGEKKRSAYQTPRHGDNKSGVGQRFTIDFYSFLLTLSLLLPLRVLLFSASMAFIMIAHYL